MSLCIPFGVACLLGALVSSSAPAFDPAVEFDPAVDLAVRAAQPGERVPLLVLMDEQGVSAALRRSVRVLPLAERRGHIRGALKERSSASQAPLLRWLRSRAALGHASEPRSLWMVNGVAVDLDARDVSLLRRFPEIRRVQWDPVVPASVMADEVQTTAGPSGERSGPVIPWNITRVHAPECWAAGYDGTGVLVALIDSGIDANHPDLANHIFTNPGEIPGDTVDNDQNGYVDDVHGWDCVSEDNDPNGSSPSDHGTAVAGIVCGDGASGTATGVAPGATILPVRASGGAWSDVFQGLEYAASMGADVIQMSLSQKWRENPKPDYAAWRAAAENELALGIFHANSIGNEGDNPDTDPIPFNISAPGNCPSPWLSPDQWWVGGATSVIGVGSINESDVADDVSSRGPADWEDIHAYYPTYPHAMPAQYQDYPYSGGQGGLIKPDVCAPGTMTTTTQWGGGYRSFSGTSSATPHVSGAMAILLQANPALTPEQMDMILETTSDDLGDPGKDTTYGAGCIDCYAALQKALNLSDYGYLQGVVRDTLTLDSLVAATVTVGGLPPKAFKTNALGRYRINLHASMVTLSGAAFGHESVSAPVTIFGDSTVANDFGLPPLGAGSVAGTVRGADGIPIPGARVRVKGTPLAVQLTDSLGAYSFPALPEGSTFTIEAVKFNYLIENQTLVPIRGELDTLNFTLYHGLLDDFETDQGWTRGSTDDALGGLWERDDPVGTYSGAYTVQPDSDFTATGSLCYLTENCIPGAGPAFSDVDLGTTTLVSPIWDGTVYVDPQLSYRRWFSNDTAGFANDHFRAEISTNGGGSWVVLEEQSTSQRDWVQKSFDLDAIVTLTDSMRIRFVAYDLLTQSTVEAAIDDVTVTGALVSAVEGSGAGEAPRLVLAPAAPNPFDPARGTMIRFTLPRSARTRLGIYDVQGRRLALVLDANLSGGVYRVAWDGRDARGHRAASGVYLYRLESGDQRAEGRVVLVQ